MLDRNVGDEANLAVPVLAQKHGAFANTVDGIDRRRDLAQLDTVPVKLDLIVHPSAEVEATAAQLPDSVTGPVHPAPGLAEWIWNKAFCGLCGIVEISSSHTDSTDEKFTLEALGNLLQVVAQHIRPDAIDGPPDTDRLVPILKVRRPGSGLHGGFRRSVDIVERHSQPVEETLTYLLRQRFPPAESHAQAVASADVPMIEEELPD